MTRGNQTRFVKGKSGNPNGRPRRATVSGTSAFDIIIDQMLTVTRNGVACELTIDEALQQRTYQDAISGGRSARREVLKMIARREKWLAAHKRKPAVRSVEIGHEQAAPDISDVLLLLNIATRPVKPAHDLDNPHGGILLEPWAVKAALARRKHMVAAHHVTYFQRCTRDPGSVTWP